MNGDWCNGGPNLNSSRFRRQVAPLVHSERNGFRWLLDAPEARYHSRREPRSHLTLDQRRSRMARSIPAILLTASACIFAAPGFAKECYAPDARSQERAFSRAVITEGGKTVWLGGQTGSPEKNFEGQVREIFAELDKTIKA